MPTTFTSAGYDGTVDEAQWAKIHAMVGVLYAVAGAGDLLVSGTARGIQAAAGSALGYGVLDVVATTSPVSLATPAAGQWFLIVLRRDWATNTSSVVAIPSSTGADAVMGTPPSLPTKAVGGPFYGNPGVRDDQPLAWAWTRASTTAVTVIDLRTRDFETRLSQFDLNAELEMFQTSAVALTASYQQITQWGTPVFPRQSLLPSPVAGLWTCDRAGRYIITAYVDFAAAGTGVNVALQIRKGAQILTESSGASTAASIGVQVALTVVQRLAVGDQLSIWGIRSAGNIGARRWTIDYLGA